MTAIAGQPPPRRRATAQVLAGSVGLAVAVLLGVGPAAPHQVPGPPPLAEPATATVTVVGAGAGAGAGVSGGTGPLGERLPSGQSLAYRSVPGWGFPPGTQAGAVAVAGDGTVLVAGRDLHGGGGPPTAAELMIGAYQPDTGGYGQILIPGAPGEAGGRPAAPSITGLAPLTSGDVVAFTVGAAPEPAHHPWPVLGILAKVDGEWTVAAQWTAAQLWGCSRECSGLGELVVLPGTGHVVAAQDGVPGRRNGALLAMRVAGPEQSGRFTVDVTGHHLYPGVVDPRTGDDRYVALRDLRADPTGQPGDERFVVGLWDPGDANTGQLAIQEFGYDATGGALGPVSAPTIPGDRRDDGSALYGYSAALYDQAGNLWAARHDGLAGGNLAVYAAAEVGGPVLDRPDCPYWPETPLAAYWTGDVWGQACRPDYDIVQARDVPGVTGLVQGPAGGGIVGLTLAGTLLPVRAAGEGAGMTFQIGNLVETALPLLPPAANGLRQHQLGAIDPAGRLWLAGANARPEQPERAADQWLYAVRVADLFDPPAVRLPDVPGQAVTVQAEYTATTATDQIPGAWAAVEVNSRAHMRGCTGWPTAVGCSYDGVAGNGFVLNHRSGLGHLAGAVAYPVEVPSAGRYRVAYRAFTFAVTTIAEITLTAGGASYTMPISTGGEWRTVFQPEPIELPAGQHLIQLAPPEGQGGWHLNWFQLQRA